MSHSFVEYFVKAILIQNSKKVNRNSWLSSGLMYALLSTITIKSSIIRAVQKQTSPVFFALMSFISILHAAFRGSKRTEKRCL